MASRHRRRFFCALPRSSNEQLFTYRRTSLLLRGLAARAPYFHNGSAATLLDAVNFYDQRFNIGFTNRQKQDLVNFLNTL